MITSPWARRFDTASQAMAAFSAIALLLPTTWIHVALSLVVLFWGLGGNYREKFSRIYANPVALWTLGLLLCFVFGVFYTSADFSAALKMLGKYHKLLYASILISVLHEDRWRYRVYFTLIVAIVVNMILIYGIPMGLIPPGPDAQEYTIFKGRIAWPFFLAFGTYMMAHHFVMESKRRWLWGMLIILSLYNILFLNSGRTGQVVILSLIMLFSFQQGRTKGLILGLTVVVFLVAVTMTTSPLFRQRLHEEAIDLHKEDGPTSSTGLRLAFYENTLRLIAHHPLLGGGTGSFANNYRVLSQKRNTPFTDNPHNEYLMIASQLGLLGLAIFLLLGYRQWRSASLLPSPYKEAAQGLVIAMATGCLFNSFLMDNSEGHFYVVVTGILFSGLNPKTGAVKEPRKR